MTVRIVAMRPIHPRPVPRQALVVAILLGVEWALAGTAWGAEGFGSRLWGRRSKDREQTTEDAMRVLQSNCVGCHNAEKHRGGLALDNREAILKGGDSGKAVVPRKPEKSLLYGLLGPEADPHMPPKKQLSTNQVGAVRRWIQDGARWDPVIFARLSISSTRRRRG